MLAPGGRSLAVATAAAAVALLSSPRAALVDWFDAGAPPMLASVNRENYAYAVYLREHTRPATTIAAP